MNMAKKKRDDRMGEDRGRNSNVTRTGKPKPTLVAEPQHEALSLKIMLSHAV